MPAMTEGSESDGGNAIESTSNTITSNISKGQLFGPFSNPLHWLSFKSCEDNNNTNPSKELFSKIEIARHSTEQNIKIIYRNGNFYFKAIRNICLEDNNNNNSEDRHNEAPKLYAWFSHELENRLPRASSSSINGITRYFCPLCNEVFMYSNVSVAHILCICPKRIQIDSIPVPSNGSVRPINSSSTEMKASLNNGSVAVAEVKPQVVRKRGFSIASLIRDESNESFPNKRNKNGFESNNSEDNTCPMNSSSSAFHRPKSPNSIRKNNGLSLTSPAIDMSPSSLMTSAFKKVDHKLSSVTNPYDFSTLYQRVASTSVLPSSTASMNHPMLAPMTIPAPMPSTLPSLSSSKSMSNTLLPYLPPSLAALTFPTSNWCAKCNATFRMTSDLVYHMRSHHKSAMPSDTMKKKREEKLRCNICNETFRERHHLTRHMTSHQ